MSPARKQVQETSEAGENIDIGLNVEPHNCQNKGVAPCEPAPFSFSEPKQDVGPSEADGGCVEDVVDRVRTESEAGENIVANVEDHNCKNKGAAPCEPAPFSISDLHAPFSISDLLDPFSFSCLQDVGPIEPDVGCVEDD